MPISRLRLQLAAWFAAAVLVAVAVVNITLYVYLRRDAESRFTGQLQAAGQGVLAAVRRELDENSESPAQAATATLDEWPAGAEAFTITTDDGHTSTRGSTALLGAISRTANGRRPGEVWAVRTSDEVRARLTVVSDTLSPPLRVVVARSTKDVEELGELLGRWLILSIPGVSLFALVAGYLLARRALTPVREMTAAITRIEPDDLTRRLPVREPPDELDDLAAQFNDMLLRLTRARERNRAFIAQAAHQLKTPLTIVRGESELGLDRTRDPEEHRVTLQRVRQAADQMARRVDGLFLLAQADAGERPTLTDEVELDGLALESADLMRGRAQRARRSLELDRVESAVAYGNAQLLREALIELVENALKYGGDGPVRISAYNEGDRAYLAVASAGPPIAPSARPRLDGGGLGLSILRWIAGVHHGELQYAAAAGVNTFTLTWPTQA
jgi:signal transduction histidine kinase